MVHAETSPGWRGCITAGDTLRGLHRVLSSACAQNVSTTASFSRVGLMLWAFDDDSVVTTNVPANEFSSITGHTPSTVTVDWQRACGFFNDATALHISLFGSTRLQLKFHYGEHMSKQVDVFVSARDDEEFLQMLSAVSRMPEMTRMVLSSSDAARVSSEGLSMCDNARDVVAVSMNTRDVVAATFGERGLTVSMQTMKYRYRSYVPAVMENIRGQTHAATVRARKLLTHVRNTSALNATMAIGFCKDRNGGAGRLFAQVFWGARLGAETHVCVAPVVEE